MVAAAITQTLGLRETGSQALWESLQHYLQGRHMLLLLDNFEHVLPAAPLVGKLLAACYRLKVLVTSRALLHLSGEHEFVVPPLALPDLQALPSVGVLAQYAAIDLFVRRTQAHKPDFTLTEANAPVVAEICVRLDGLPLAIELAAARSKLFAPQALLARLTSRLGLLTGGAQDLPARQQTIRSTIDWSYDLLDASEQALFRRLGVFVGGCTLDAAQAICAGPELEMHHGGRQVAPRFSALDGLTALVDRSLLRQGEGASGAGFFRLSSERRQHSAEMLC